MVDFIKRLFSKEPKGDERNKPLNLYQYKFLRYKENRDKRYNIDLSRVHTAYKKGLVSIILPVYNGADVVSESIKSVLNQTYTNFELIIINDGSKDETLRIINQYAEKDDRIKVVDQENRKIPRTLSRGFEMAQGEFFTWTSADNIMVDNYIERMVSELESQPNTGMVYANMRLIDAKGRWYRRHGWFEFPLGSGNVILPTNTYELNTYANNTIGAAFMYRSKIADAICEYSKYKHTLEDYDYWMRINSLFNIRHASFIDPIYFYRWHDNSLTAKDEELGITKNRYKLMVLDDFRRDFYLSPLIWYIESDESGADGASRFRKVLENAGHIVIEKSDFPHLFFGREARNMCYINFGNAESDTKVPEKAIKICVMPNCEILPKDYDIYVSREIDNITKIGNHRGWFAFEDTESMFAFIDIKAKNELLYRMEGSIEGEKKYDKKLSVILCTNRSSDTVKECLKSICNQSAKSEDYEIVFVNNSFKDKNIKELALDIQKEFENIDVNYITAPIGGLSFARNTGLWEARGEYVLYIDDDAIADFNLVEETINAFEHSPDFGVIGGQVILDPPVPKPELLVDEVRPLWSELVIDGEGCREVKDYGEFPYGANFAARTQSLMQIGGFRCTYGRIGNNFGGGEETLVAFMMNEINMKVGLNPKSKVLHKVESDRYTLEHIKRTAYAGILTQYQLRKDLYAPQDWTDGYVAERARKAKTSAGKLEEGTPQYIYQNAIFRAFDDVLKRRQDDYEYLNSYKSKEY